MVRHVRDAYLEDASEALKQLDHQMEVLRTAAERSRSAHRTDLERALDELRGLRNRAEAKLEDVRRAADDAWRLTKVHADAALAQFKSGLDGIEALMHRVAA